MKKTGKQPRALKQEHTIYIGARAAHPAVAGPDNYRDLADVVWKYFSEEITGILTELHKDLSASAHNQVSNRK